ncbi:MAG: desulfoferrodoxin family protein [Actinomycetota bacterium]|nr:desulfoferrodoxin family protein [Actinomycetota bacterium]
MSDAPILGAVNHVTDLDVVTDFERKHTPYLEAESVEGGMRITVKVGYYAPHPNGPDHFINWIELVVGDATIARFDLSPVATQPDASIVVTVDPGTTIRAVEHCNLHGLWVAEIAV